MSAVYVHKPGALAFKTVIAGMKAGSFATARDAYGTHADVVKLIKAQVNPMALSGDGGALVGESIGEIMQQGDVYYAFNPAKLPGLRQVPFNVRCPVLQSAPTAGWVGEFKGKQVSAAGFGAGVRLEPKKVTSMFALSKELVEVLKGPTLDTVQNDFATALGPAIDRAAFDGQPETDDRPASITYDAPVIDAAGDPSQGIRDALDAFTGDPLRMVAVAHPKTAMKLALATTSGGALLFPASGLFRGANLAGVPLLASNGVAEGDVVLLDPGYIAYAAGSLVVSVSQEACIMLDSASPVQTSLWQNNLVASLLERFVNWSVGKPGAVVIIDNVLVTA